MENWSFWLYMVAWVGWGVFRGWLAARARKEFRTRPDDGMWSDDYAAVDDVDEYEKLRGVRAKLNEQWKERERKRLNGWWGP